MQPSALAPVPGPIEYRCTRCRSTDICFDAWSVWNSESQSFELFNTFPDGAPPVCNECGEYDFETVNVEPERVLGAPGTTYVLTHEHRHGTDTRVFRGPAGLERLVPEAFGRLLRVLDIDFEPERGEAIEINGERDVLVLSGSLLEQIIGQGS